MGDALNEIGGHLAANLRQIREQRSLTQAQLAALCQVPRSTIANIEAGGSNPTLAVLVRLAAALALTLEELLAPPRVRCEVFSAEALPRVESRRAGRVLIHKLLPHPIPGAAIDRVELDPGAKIAGSPHQPGTYEYTYCERGQLGLWIAGEHFELAKGQVAAFDGHQKHTYENTGRTLTVVFSVVVLAPMRKLGG